MFCEKCGRQIPNIARFCPRCGNRIGGNVYPVEYNMNETYNIPDNGEIRFSHSSTSVAGRVFLCFLCSAFQVGLFIVLFSIDTWKKQAHKKTDREFLDFLKVFIIIFIVHFFVLILLNCIKLGAVSKTVLCLKNDIFYGTGGTPNYFGNVSFSCKYEDVISITSKGTAVNIITISGNYKLLLNEQYQAINELYQRVERAKTK